MLELSDFLKRCARMGDMTEIVFLQKISGMLSGLGALFNAALLTHAVTRSEVICALVRIL